MDLSPLQHAADFIRKAKRIGIVIPKEADLDQVTSSRTLGQVLDSLGKPWGFIFNPLMRDNWKFLQLNPLEKTSIKNDVVITIDTGQSPIGEIRYEKKENKLEIIISPKDSPLKKELVFVEEVTPSFDLLVSIGVASLEKIAGNFKNPHLLFNTALVNIDSNPDNESFGEVNVIEKEAAANSEIIFKLIKKLDPKPLDQKSANLILAGVIYKIKSLKKNVTPQTELVISELKSRGGDEEVITNNLFKTESLNLLKLWGRASVRSKKENEKNLFWSFVTAEDFEKTSTAPADLKFVLDHFEEHFNLPQFSAFLWQEPGPKSVRAILRLENKELLGKINGEAGGKIQGKFLNLDNNFADFREAEAKIRALLSEVI